MTLTNLPMIYALFCGWYNKLRGKPDLSEASSGGSYPLSSYPRDHVGGSRNPRPVPGHTVFDSKEHINVKEDHHAESDVDERSLDLPKQLCSVRNLSANGWVVETGRRAASSSVERNGSLDQLNQILVTTEYTVYNEEDIKRAG